MAINNRFEAPFHPFKAGTFQDYSNGLASSDVQQDLLQWLSHRPLSVTRNNLAGHMKIGRPSVTLFGMRVILKTHFWRKRAICSMKSLMSFLS